MFCLITTGLSRQTPRRQEGDSEALTFERDLIVERAQAGLKAAVTRGRKGWRKPVVTSKKLEQARADISGGLAVREAAARFKTSLYNALKDQKAD